LQPLDSARLDEWLNQLLYAAADSRIALDLQGATLHRFQDQIWLTRGAHAAPLNSLTWQGEAQLAWGEGKLTFTQVTGEGISAARLARAPVTIARRSGGERLQADVRRPHRTLKNLLQEERILPWERDTMPLLYCGEDIVWVPGVGIACEYQCAAGEPGWRLVWERLTAACQ